MSRHYPPKRKPKIAYDPMLAGEVLGAIRRSDASLSTKDLRLQFPNKSAEEIRRAITRLTVRGEIVRLKTFREAPSVNVVYVYRLTEK